MTICVAAERSLLSYDEWEAVELSHYPKLADLDADALRDLRARLKDQREKAKTLAFHKRRESRGKGERRAAGATGDSDHARRRKQVFVQAVKRTNRQLKRIEHAEALVVTVGGQQKALAMVRAQQSHRPDGGRTAGRGMRDNPSLRRAMGINPAKVGSVSQSVKSSQARQDARA